MHATRLRPPVRGVITLLLATLVAGTGCPTDDQAEAQRRISEAGIDTPAEQAAVAAQIAALETDLAGLFSESLADRMVAHGVPGVTIAVVNGGVVEWVEDYGVYDTSAGTPIERRSPLQGASLSKPTTALGVLQLVEAGLIDLDEPLNDVLTSWQIPDNAFTAATPVTLRHVLSHTAGINNSGFFGYAPGSPVPSLLALLDGQAPANHVAIAVVQEPGTDWMYSGGAYTVIAQVIEDVTGQPYADWMLANVLVPAGMWESSFRQPSPDPRTIGTLIGNQFGLPFPAFTYPELPAAGLWSTARDLGRMVVAIQRSIAGSPGALLGAPAAANLITPQSPSPSFFDLGLSPSPRMGLGLFLADGADPDWFWHTGSNVGFQSVLVGDTQGLGYGIAVMTNSSGGIELGWEIVNAIADLYAWPNWGNWGL